MGRSDGESGATCFIWEAVFSPGWPEGEETVSPFFAPSMRFNGSSSLAAPTPTDATQDVSPAASPIPLMWPLRGTSWPRVMPLGGTGGHPGMAWDRATSIRAGINHRS